MSTWLLHVAGLDNGSGRWYLWWSGAGADLGELAIIGGLATIVRRHNCEIHGCWRVGRHPVDGTGYVVCRRHHPDGPLSAGQVAGQHREAP
jgi:hypothetical protein